MSLPESFKVYKKKVTVMIDDKEENFDLLPLTGTHYAKFMTLFKKTNHEPDPSLSDEENMKIAGNKFFDSLTEEDLKVYHSLILEMFVKSYNAKGDEVLNLDMFISKNLLLLISVLPEVNLPESMLRKKG